MKRKILMKLIDMLEEKPEAPKKERKRKGQVAVYLMGEFSHYA
jgi:hypothetical protein